MLAVPFACTLAGLALVLLVGGPRPRAAPWIGAAAATATAIAILVLWVSGERPSLDLWALGPFAPLSLAFDPLGASLALLAAGLAAAVLVYTSAYLPHHLRERDRSPAELRRFCALILVFLLGILALAFAADLIAVFLALELTAMVSFLLIAFDWQDPKARRAALLALVLTAGTALLLLVGALLVGDAAGSLAIADLRVWAAGDEPAPIAVACMLVALVAKSAQVPLHVWLPRAMVAPTPVSAYLHSAALVATGAFVLQRLWFLVSPVDWMPALVYAIGMASIAIGSSMALAADELKRLLAYSTVAQYGYVLVLLGSGGDAALAGAPLYLFAHGLAKCALFLTAGAVTQATGAAALSATGGLARAMPRLAVASAIAAAGLAGLPLTIGYAKDELWLKAAEHLGVAPSIVATAAAALTLAYVARFWCGIFLGPARPASRPAAALTAPVVALAVAIVVLGVWHAPTEALARGAGRVVAGHAVEADLAYSLSLTTVLAVGAWLAGTALFVTRRFWLERHRAACRWMSHALGPARRIDKLSDLLAWISRRLHEFEIRDLRDRIGAVLVPLALLVLLGWLAEPWVPWKIGALALEDLPLAIALLVLAAAAIAVARAPALTEVVLSLAFAGYALALVFALIGAPDVALVAVIAETLLTLLALATLRRLRLPLLLRVAKGGEPRRRNLFIAIGAGLAAAAIAWTALAPTAPSSVSTRHLELADQAHADDVVSAILSDFRGLDTAVEITVLAIAVLGAVSLVRKRRR